MIRKLTALLLLWSFAANAGLPPTTIQGQSDASPKTKFSFQVPYNQFTDLGGIKALVETGNKNVLTNASFEHTTYSTGWTITTATGAKETVNVKDGKQAASLTFSASTGDIAQSVTPTINTNSQNWEASCQVKTTVSTISVCAIVNGVETCPTTSNVAASGTWNMGTMNFIGPTDGQPVGVRVKTTASATGTVYVDDCYVGPARNLSQVSQAQAFGGLKYPATGSCTWTVSQLTFAADYPANAACGTPTLSGQAAAPATKIPGITFASMPPGEYYVVGTGFFFKNNNQSGRSSFRFFDGTTGSQENQTYGTTAANSLGSVIGRFVYTTAQSNVTIRVQGRAADGTALATDILADEAGLDIAVYYFPSQSQTALRPDATPASFGGNLSGSGTSANTGASAALSGSAGTLTPTAATNLTCTAGSAAQSISCPLPRGGNWEVCVSGSVSNTTATNNFTTLAAAGSVIAQDQITSTNGASSPVYAGFQRCGLYKAPGSGSVQFQIFGGVSAGTGTWQSTTWTVKELDAPMSAPYLVGSVTSNTSGQDRIAYATWGSCTTATCTVSTQSGITSVTRNSTGSYTVNFAASTFSGAPACSYQCSGERCFSGGLATTSSYNPISRDSTGTATDSGANMVTCMGPR